MCSQTHRLPSELWTHVFGLLCPADKLRVRATCKYFKTVVDQPALWRDWAVELRLSNGAYREHFWRTLRRWKVSSASVRSSVRSSSRCWTQLARDLPGLTALVIDECHRVVVDTLQHFRNLRRLCVRRGSAHLSLRDFLALAVSPQLTHLSLCNVMFLNTPLKNFTLPDNARVQFTSLKSLVCHDVGFCGDPVSILYSILASLPQLQHLSLSLSFSYSSSSRDPDLAPLQSSSLCSLELLECTHWSLSGDFMQLLPPLQSLAVFYKTQATVYGEAAPEEAHLRHWLRDQPGLSSLVVVNGPSVSEFVNRIPPSVTDLTLRPLELSSGEMRALSAQLPGLRSLHLEPARYLGRDTALIPQLFPKLRTLRIPEEQVPEEDFLSLVALEDLEDLEIQDRAPTRPALLARLRGLTQNRVRISTRQRDPLWSCDCAFFMCTQPWTLPPAWLLR